MGSRRQRSPFHRRVRRARPISDFAILIPDGTGGEAADVSLLSRTPFPTGAGSSVRRPVERTSIRSGDRVRAIDNLEALAADSPINRGRSWSRGRGGAGFEGSRVPSRADCPTSESGLLAGYLLLTASTITCDVPAGAAAGPPVRPPNAVGVRRRRRGRHLSFHEAALIVFAGRQSAGTYNGNPCFLWCLIHPPDHTAIVCGYRRPRALALWPRSPRRRLR